MARKKKQLPLLEKVTITDVAAEGMALARVNDLVVFVPYVVPGDVREVFIQTVAHRLLLSPKAEGSGKTAQMVLGEILARVPSPKLR